MPQPLESFGKCFCAPALRLLFCQILEIDMNNGVGWRGPEYQNMKILIALEISLKVQGYWLLPLTVIELAARPLREGDTLEPVAQGVEREIQTEWRPSLGGAAATSDQEVLHSHPADLWEGAGFKLGSHPAASGLYLEQG